LSIHHLLVQKIDGKLAVSFDVEVDGATKLEAAHARATALESAVRDSLGANVEVESHIEPLPERMLVGRAATPAIATKLATSLQKIAKKQSILTDVHNVRVRTTDDGILLHYHCRFPPETQVTDVHAVVDQIEDQLKAANASLRRVVAHAEPTGAPLHLL
jgi:divalent metal cation (Fe/Co/Zn/Cd) transporter